MKKQINIRLRLDILADKVYGNALFWKIIRRLNGLSLPFGPLLKIGKIILISEEV